MEIKDDIHRNLRLHEPFIVIYYKLIYFPDINLSDSKDKSSNYNMVNPDLIDLIVVSNGDSNHQLLLRPPGQFYFIFSQLNDAQKHFLGFTMTYIMKCKTAFKSNVKEPEPFHGSVVGKSFFINVITEYIKRNIKYHCQKFLQELFIHK